MPIIPCSHISISLIAVLLLIVVMAVLPVASAVTTTYDFSSDPGTTNWAYLKQCSDKPHSTNSEPNTQFSSDDYNNIPANDGTMQENKADGGSYAAHRFEFTISENTNSITQIYAFWNGKGEKMGLIGTKGATLYIWNYDSGSYEQLDTNSDETEVDLAGTITSNIGNYIDANGYLIILIEQNAETALLVISTIYTDYVKVDVTHTSISSVTTDKLTYKNGETITTTWTSADGFGSGEDYINVEYWDETTGTQFNLTSHDTSATSSTSKALTDSEVGHKINVYVYTTSSSSGDRSTNITEGDPWPYSVPLAVMSWGSYNDSAHSNPDDTFSGDEHYVYMQGDGFMQTHDYKVAYYDVHGWKAQTEADSSDGTGALSSQYDFTSNVSSAAGLWHSVVLNTTGSAPNTYDAALLDANYTVNDEFTVEQSAIPEFPTVIAAIAVCMLCAVAYVVMRRKVGKKG